MRILRPGTLKEAYQMLAEGGGKLTPIAGGTDLMVSWNHRAKDGLTLMDLSLLCSKLGTLWLTETSLELGALATYWDVISSPAVSAAFPLLREAGLQVGAVQIQTRGTWAGNIGNGSPAADGVPVLMAYDAEVVLGSREGERTVPLAEYWTGYKQTVKRPEELIIAIRLPRRAREVQWWEKVGSRAAQAITKVGVAVVKDTAGWRVAANSVAPYVKRCRALEQALDAGASFDSPEAIGELLSRDIAPIDDIRSTAIYRAAVLSRVLFHGLRGTPAGH